MEKTVQQQHSMKLPVKLTIWKSIMDLFKANFVILTAILNNILYIILPHWVQYIVECFQECCNNSDLYKQSGMVHYWQRYNILNNQVQQYIAKQVQFSQLWPAFSAFQASQLGNHISDVFLYSYKQYFSQVLIFNRSAIRWIL